MVDIVRWGALTFSVLVLGAEVSLAFTLHTGPGAERS